MRLPASLKTLFGWCALAAILLVPSAWAQTEAPAESPAEAPPEAVAPEAVESAEPANPEENKEPSDNAETSESEKPEATPADQSQAGESPKQPAEEPKADREADAAEGAEDSEQPPAEEAPMEESAEEPADESTESDDANGEAEPESSEESASSEDSAEVPSPATVEWNEDIEKVFTKRYPESADDLRVIEKQTQRVLAAATPSTVSIQIGGAFGSGVIVGPDGLVLTAGHVCGKPGRKAVFIFPDGSRVRGVTLGVNRQIDSGMARITDPGPWPYMKMAEAGKIENGDWVVAVGQPGGFDEERTPPVRLGRVLFANDDVINTDCTLVGGDSGGPLFNMRGEVIGIHSRIGQSITNNFHVPIGTYHATRERLVSGEIWGGRLGSREPVRQRALLGVSGNSLGGKAEITEVFRGMPADRAGIQVGDIVESLDGKPIESFDDFARRVLSSKPGSQVKIGIVRDDKPIEIEVRLAGTQKALPGSPDVEPPSEDEEDS